MKRTTIALVVEILLSALDSSGDRRWSEQLNPLAFSNVTGAVSVNLADKLRRLFVSPNDVLWSHCRPNWPGVS